MTINERARAHRRQADDKPAEHTDHERRYRFDGWRQVLLAVVTSREPARLQGRFAHHGRGRQDERAAEDELHRLLD